MTEKREARVLAFAHGKWSTEVEPSPFGWN
jgi:hypothetical protein